MWGGVLAVIIIVGIVAVAKNSPATNDSSVIKVGVIAPLTGPLAEYGEAFRNGISLAQEKLGNTKLSFVFEDSAYDSAKAISAYNKLKDLNKVNVVVNWGDPTSQALAPLFKNSKIPFIAVTTIPSVAQNDSSIIRTLNKAEDDAEMTWSYLRSKNMKNVAIVKLETAYFNTLLSAMSKFKKADETITVIDTYLSFGDMDFKTTITKLKNNKYFDVVGVFLASGQISQFYNQSAAIGMKTSTFGTDFFENQSDIDNAGKNINGAVFVNYEVSDAFRAEYLAKYKNVSQIAYAGNGYDTVMILNSATDSSKASIMKAFSVIKNYNGVLGEWIYNKTADDQYLSSPFHVKIIQDGKIEVIK